MRLSVKQTNTFTTDSVAQTMHSTVHEDSMQSADVAVNVNLNSRLNKGRAVLVGTPRFSTMNMLLGATVACNTLVLHTEASHDAANLAAQ